MDWPDWLFAAVLLLGLWELATILDAGPARSRALRRRAGDRDAAGGAGPAPRRRPGPGDVVMVEALVIVAGVGVWLAVALYDARTHPPAVPRTRTRERRRAVADLLFVALAVGFFVAMLGYAVACEKLLTAAGAVPTAPGL